MSDMKIIIIGNCLSLAISTAIRSIVPVAEVVNLHFQTPDIVKGFEDHCESASFVFAQLGLDENIYPDEFASAVERFGAANPQKVFRYPRVVFSGFHPDCVYTWSRDGGPPPPSEFAYHSAIAVEAFRRGFDVEKTVALFNESTFEALGYFDYYEPSLAALTAECARAGLPHDVFPRKWIGKAFMYSINHPRMYVAFDLAEHLLRCAGIPLPAIHPEREVPDTFFYGPIWPVYPEIAKRLKVQGGYFFMPPTDYQPNARHEVCDLRRFIERSFETYRTLDFDQVALSQPTTTQFNQIESELFDEAFACGLKSPPSEAAALNPYSNAQDHRMWRRAVSSVSIDQVDPYVRAPFGIEPTTKIATAGSCFAQHIAKALERSGYVYHVTERAPDNLPAEEAEARNFGTFSARYGNIYTARQLVQMIQRAYGEFAPEESAWTRADGKFVDPFRPQVEPNGFATVADLEQSRDAHLAAVREMVETSDVFVFTLGLTEGWRSRSDGAVFPLAPGTAAGTYDEDRYEFVNFRVDEVIADVDSAIAMMRSRNPMLRFIITVSPVPLIATCELDTHVLTATTYSKSVLRVAAEEASRRHGGVAYFPSYEIITGNYNRGVYFSEDLRDVKMAGVEHVMRLFFRHFAIDQWADHVAAPSSIELSAMSKRIGERISGLYQVVCDEEILDGMAKA